MRKFGFVKVAAAIPHVTVADPQANAGRIVEMMHRAEERGVEILSLPELSVTGYTCGDLFLQQRLLKGAEQALQQIAEESEKLSLTVIVGLPVAHEGKLYNCAAVVSGGEICGLVPKINIPNHGDSSEGRWFTSGRDVESAVVGIAGQMVDLSSEMLFKRGNATFGVELCEDLWVGVQPSARAAQAGAQIVFNLAATPEQIGKHEYRQSVVAQHSARIISAYVYSSAGFGESSTDVVYSGGAMIAEYGTILASAERFSIEEQMIVADVDIDLIESMRLRTTTFGSGEYRRDYFTVDCLSGVMGGEDVSFDRVVDPMPFVPSDRSVLSERCREVLEIQALGLAQRLSATGCKRVVLGVSGGLDSTLALLVITRAFDKLSLDRADIIGITMPGFGTTGRTHNNALDLMRALGITMREISIKAACIQHFADIGLADDDRSVSYENSQARERTQILMDVANMCGAMVIGTGDLSELALGWATYNGDQMSMYGVNASVPKTMVRHLVRWYAECEATTEVSRILLDVVDTPVSPELLPANDKGEIQQKTEDLVGPYELHDFFLYNFVRRGFEPKKIEFLAQHAFEGRYDNTTIRKWLTTFLRRFFSQQFKRSAMPDGPKTGSVSLSPRGDWQMPSDASVREWLRDVE